MKVLCNFCMLFAVAQSTISYYVSLGKRYSYSLAQTIEAGSNLLFTRICR